jgi:dihydroorotase
MGSTTGNILLNDDEELIPAVRDALATGKRVSVHAEDDSLILRETERCTRDHLRNRPAKAELNAISRLARNFRGQRINICHVTTPEGLDLARDAGFTTEVTMHHMMFEVDRNSDQFYKVNPPIRDIATRDTLYKRFLAGDFTMIGTDHAPHSLAEKQQDFDSAPGGMPGVETTIPIVMNMVRKGTISLAQAVRMGAIAPGQSFDLRKGEIKVGNDADLAIFDMRKASAIDVKRLHSKCGHTQYAGMEAVFPDTVIIRGEVQVEGAELCGEQRGVDICG